MRRKVLLPLLGISVVLILTLAFKLLSSVSVSALVREDEIVLGGVKYYHESKKELDKRNIYIFNKATSEKKIIYQTPKSYVDQISISPNREFIAAIETDEKAKNNLVVIKANGELVKAINQDVRKYCWSPEGNKIAFITGGYSEDGKGFLSDGVYVFDIASSQLKQIAPRAYYINWVAFDSSIYYYESKNVFRYDPVAAETEETPYRGVNFSPDGQYYTTSSPEQPYQVYSTKTNQAVTDRLFATFKDSTIRPSWVPDQKHQLLVVRTDYELAPSDSGEQKVKKILGIKQARYAIYDIEEDEIIKEWIEKP